MSVPTVVGTRSPGTGPALLLGPSLGTSTALWGPAAALLTGHFDAIAWDLPGHGGSPATREPFSVSDLADAVVRLADDASVPEFYYAGVSLGGHVGLELALRHPSRLLGLAIICSAAKFGDAAAWTARAATVRAQGTPVLIDGAAKRWFSEGFIARQSARSSGMLHDLSDTDDESYALCCDALATSDIRSSLGDITTPTLAVYGENDPVVGADEAEFVAEGVQHGAALRIHDASHLAAIERPEVVAGALIDFFGKGAGHD